jgi:hypothetical protein
MLPLKLPESESVKTDISNTVVVIVGTYRGEEPQYECENPTVALVKPL